MDPPRRRLPPRLDRRGRPPAAAGGKALRPALALLSARAAETSYETALPGAVAVEFVHAFSLLHDDIMDGDRTRRHRPAAWTVFGPSAAILGGDALLALSEELLLDQHTRGAHWAARALTAATQRLISGQALDIGFESRDDVALDECLTMAADKTGALLACACSIGAMLGEGPTRLVTALTGYGAELGLAFQLVDDLLGIWGSPETTGKPVLSDLRARKKSLPVVYALTSGRPESRRLADLYADPEPPSEDALREMARLVEAAGGRDWAAAEADRRIAAADRCLDDSGMDGLVAAEFRDIARFVTSRDH
ncbi:polyprenyl synthetase family protein [Actinomadura madurae]|uniref:polyprenyl synthetase family protein n=1 Tax=Actinomadura madurae TaxID=1993 RepID=UPI0020D255E0|nr:polyprenyl synthetase family protein [Actinomadura madurae]MCP9953509.1 polyprenyl synthetase family protein [Actinomadura madurae]MCP9982739.1 polyprenyl synthetase family protein [Actinomadura madurae]MCQ0018975.1 polyprenyl synthetase family protein [Actinomadura madurae]